MQAQPKKQMPSSHKPQVPSMPVEQVSSSDELSLAQTPKAFDVEVVEVKGVSYVDYITKLVESASSNDSSGSDAQPKAATRFKQRPFKDLAPSSSDEEAERERAGQIIFVVEASK